MTDAAVTPRPMTPAEFVREGLMERLPAMLPDDMPVDRFVGLTLQVIARNPALAQADRNSLLLALLDAARDHLEPTGASGGAHLVVFGGKVQMIHDYRGTQTLIRRGGGGEVKAVAVYNGDIFRVIEGTQVPHIVHRPRFKTRTPDALEFVYAWPLNDPTKFEVMTKSDVDAIRSKSRAANNGPWVTDYVQMARKTVIKRLANYLSLTPDVRASIERDTEREFDGEREAPPTVRRSESIKARLSAGKRQPPVDAPGRDEDADPPADTAPPPFVDEAPAPAAEGTAVCGAICPPELGEDAVCIKPPGHDGPHQSAGESRWPAK